jgi:hypothetical protein
VTTRIGPQAALPVRVVVRFWFSTALGHQNHFCRVLQEPYRMPKRRSPGTRNGQAFARIATDPVLRGNFGMRRTPPRAVESLLVETPSGVNRAARLQEFLAAAPSRRRDVQLLARRVGERTAFAGRRYGEEKSADAFGGSDELHGPEPASGGNGCFFVRSCDV